MRCCIYKHEFIDFKWYSMCLFNFFFTLQMCTFFPVNSKYIQSNWYGNHYTEMDILCGALVRVSKFRSYWGCHEFQHHSIHLGSRVLKSLVPAANAVESYNSTLPTTRKRKKSSLFLYTYSSVHMNTCFFSGREEQASSLSLAKFRMDM